MSGRIGIGAFLMDTSDTAYRDLINAVIAQRIARLEADLARALATLGTIDEKHLHESDR